MKRILLLMMVMVAVVAGAADPVPTTVRLHPDLPEVLDRAWVERLGLFPEFPDLQRVSFQTAVWGGVVARLETSSQTFERGLDATQMDMLRHRARLAVAGQPMPDWPMAGDPVPANRAWPETPAPPAAPERVKPSALVRMPIDGKWLAMIELGSRLNVTGFNEFFGPQVQFGVSFGYAVTRQVVPTLGFYAGFGDIRSEFEDAYGDGRANNFGFVANLILRAEFADWHALYVEGGGGYHIRSLYWGSVFVDPATGTVREGRALEQKDLGWNVRVGWQLARPTENRPRLFDVGIGVQTMPAHQWFFATDTAVFEASERDTWVMLTFRLWDGL